MIHVAKDGRRFMGSQRGRKYDESLDDKGQPKGETKDGGHMVKRHVERDSSQGPTSGLPKVPTSDPDRKGDGTPGGEHESQTSAAGSPDQVNPPANPDGVESAPGGNTWDSDLREHGMAHEITTTFDSSGAHVKATHADGYVHESHHLDAVRASDAARVLAGVTPEMEPQETPQTRARNYPVGPKEESRMKKENQGMGINVGDKIPGLA